MRVERVEPFPITFLHGREPLAYCFVRLTADDGTVGWGEACDSFGCTWAGVVAACIAEALGPLVVGEDPGTPELVAAKLRAWTRRRLGDQGVALHAISAVELACWDLAGRAAGVPSLDLPGVGRVRDAVPVYASSVFLEEGPPDWHLDLLQPCLERGVTAVKLRMGPEWEADLATLEGVRDLLPDGVALMIDGNECFTAPTALIVADRLADLGVQWFEEPVPQHHRAAIEEVVQRSPVPIAYGEHLFGVHDFSDCLARRQADVIQPDAALAGGFGECRRIAALAAPHGVRVVPHCAAGPVALAANLQLAASVPGIRLLEYPYPLAEMWAATAPGAPLGPDALRDGCLPVLAAPGFGVDLDEAALAARPYLAPAARAGLPSRFQGDR
jgi:L-alanine-DL-glutamate epimerase-like enolase superfamily enzyme